MKKKPITCLNEKCANYGTENCIREARDACDTLDMLIKILERVQKLTAENEALQNRLAEEILKRGAATMESPYRALGAALCGPYYRSPGVNNGGS